MSFTLSLNLYFNGIETQFFSVKCHFDSVNMVKDLN